MRRGRGKRGSLDSKPKRAYVPELDEDDEGLIAFPETFSWLINEDTRRPLSSEELDWKEGPKKISPDGETNFISEDTLEKFVEVKTALNGYEDWKVRKAKKRCNPFEEVKTGSFVNRSWLKMANMDSLLGGLFTADGLSDDEELTFADICGGPGGFVEYVLWRKKYQGKAKGYGITLKDAPDYDKYKHQEFKNANSKDFETHYGVGRQRGDGDITKNENIDAFVSFVMDRTGNQGVHFAMADGAFELKPEEDHCKDAIFQRLFLCQLIIALQVVRPGGHYVTNMFDIVTPFTAGLVYIMYRCFDRVCVLKPVTSRPHNSERFVVCEGKVADTSFVTKFLSDVNLEMERIWPGDAGNDSKIVELVPLEIMLKDRKFTQYITDSNEKITKTQIQFLKKVKIFVTNPELYDARYVDLPSQCVRVWNIPEVHGSNDQYSEYSDSEYI